MKKTFLCGLLLMVGTILEVCAQSIILDNKLQFNSADALASPPDGWNFENCSLAQVPLNSTYFVKLNNGSITTPRLEGLAGNARIYFLIRPTESDYTFSLSVEGAGVLDRESDTYTSGQWSRGVPYLLRNVNESTRIVFHGENVMICNVEVSDMGDLVFYESFDRCAGSGGTDDIYTISSSVITSAKLDNPVGNEINGVTEGNKCVGFPQNISNDVNKAYVTPPIPSDDTSSYLFSFKAAKAKDNGKLQIQYYDNTELKWQSNTVTASLAFQEWKDITFSLDNMDASKGVYFIGSLCFLDELKIYEVKSLSMSESSLETAVASEWQDKTVCLSLTRTFQEDIWNTCCLPFDFTASLLRTAAGNNELEVELRSVSSITSEGVFHFESVLSIPAGEPFLLKVSETVSNPKFRNVVMKALEPASATSPSAPGYAFTGCYGKTTLNTDGTHVFIGTDGELHRPSSTGNTMRGMRAFFELPSYEAARGIAFDERPTGIYHPMSPSSSADVLYNLSGQRVKHPTSGLYIKNGKKIILNHK